MNTEITDKEKFEGWVLYDADCHFCVRLARHFQNALVRRRFELLPLQTPWVRSRLGLADTELMTEMRLLKPSGNSLGEADALLQISRYFWWAWPIRQMGRVPAVMNLLRAGYRWIARNRSCASGACRLKDDAIERPGRAADLLPLLVLPCLALASQSRVAPWAFMWVMAFAIFAGCKWMTYREAKSRGLAPSRAHIWGYLLLWPGMDAAGFLVSKGRLAKPAGLEWAFAIVKITVGSILLWGIARLALPAHPLLAGWIGMGGVIFILHFGLFHLLSLTWRRMGVKATPVMRNPVSAKSLTEFWGRRWNTAFNELTFRFTFGPLRRLANPTVATLLVFALSGLIHEWVISLPAHAGYGLPTLYFVTQGLGIVIERSRWGQGIGLGRGLRGWLFTILVTTGPAFWLFHPPFVKNVILPMLNAIGAT